MEKKIFRLLLICVSASFTVVAQTEGFHFKAFISAIEKPGFYNIVITPAMSANLKTDYSDLRIVNGKGKWVPHLLRLPGTVRTNHAILWDLPVVKKISNNSFTELVLKSPKSKIADLVVKIKNTEVERFCTLTGSDDSTTWFIINDSIPIRPAPSGEENTSAFTLRFPPNDYTYYKLLINNKEAAPLNIIGVATSGVDSAASIPFLNYTTENPSPEIRQEDSGKLSLVTIIQRQSYHVEKLALKISGAKYFYRRVDLYLPESSSILRPGRLLQSFIVSNNSDLQYNVSLLNASGFLLLIHNEDNPPLKLDEIKTYSNYRIATVYLEKEEKYQLLMGNKDARPANYDLQQLNLVFNKVLPEAAIGTIRSSGDMTPTGSMGSKILIWLVIIIAAISLGFFTYKLITEMNKKEKS